MILLLTLTAFTLRPVSVSTDFAEATANPATTTLTLATSGNAAILDITPSSTSGTFSSSDNSGTSLAFNVSTNNITGYNLSISHGSSTTPAPLTNEDLSENLDSLPTGTSITESQFNSTEYVGRYGYRPSKLNSQSNSNYIPAPTTSSTTLNKTTRANTTSDNYTIALGANIDYTKSAGTYTNTFILTAVANNVPYRINYLDNTSDSTVAGLPTAEASSTATASGFTLSNTTPTRTGYTFAGWCDGTVTHNATGNDTCSGTTYGAGSAYSFASPSSTSTNVANLYAMWNVKTFVITLAKTNATAIVIDGTSYTGSSVTLTYGNHTISGTYPSGYEFSSWSTSNSTNLAITSTSSASTTITVHGAATLTLMGKTSKIYMQDMTASQCTTTAQTVYDKRDDKAYLVQQLADGKCWLLDNLRLGYAGFASGVTTLDSTNTNTTTKSIPTTTFAGWNKTSGFMSTGTPMINTASADTTTTRYGSGSGKIGVYYNYCAATMQSYCYGMYSGTGDASEDVCPKGWRMPTGGSSGEYQALYTAYSSNATNFRNALSTPISGYFFNSSVSAQGGSYGNGCFWSSTYYDDSDMYYLNVSSSSVSPQSNLNRFYGFSVRCVLKEPIQSVIYMQDITSEMVANTTEGATATLIDKRDNQSYLVGKLADGKLWMLDNLRLGSTSAIVLTPDDTNIVSNFTLPASGTTCFDYNTANCDSSGDDTHTGYTVAAINIASANTITSDSSLNWGNGSHKYGVYYNYCAATAGTYCMSSSSSSTGNATSDICPKGWRMPTGGSSGEYQTLCTAVKGSACADNSEKDTNALKLREVLSTPLSGTFFNGRTYSQGYAGNGEFWSSTRNYGNDMYYLNVNGLSVYPQYSGGRYYGRSVRCILGS